MPQEHRRPGKVFVPMKKKWNISYLSFLFLNTAGHRSVRCHCLSPFYNYYYISANPSARFSMARALTGQPNPFRIKLKMCLWITGKERWQEMQSKLLVAAMLKFTIAENMFTTEASTRISKTGLMVQKLLFIPPGHDQYHIFTSITDSKTIKLSS